MSIQTKTKFEGAIWTLMYLVFGWGPLVLGLHTVASTVWGFLVTAVVAVAWLFFPEKILEVMSRPRAGLNT